MPQLSPFRYPGGKTWLVPEVRRWLDSLAYRPETLIEPFAGGGIVSLIAVVENRVDQVVMCELDEEVASVWQTIVSNDAEWLVDQILAFDMTLENVQDMLDQQPTHTRDLAFRTIVKNRAQRGGILAKGASLMKSGENGRGISSRWYPKTLAKRIRCIHDFRDRISVKCVDGIQLMQQHVEKPANCYFIDPPYTASGKSAGRRLYNHSELDHLALFDTAARLRGAFLMTYDSADEVIQMANARSFHVEWIPMKNTHHREQMELLITPSPIDQKLNGQSPVHSTSPSEVAQTRFV
ncbi:MAG: DNA adenine methylase [Caldilineaceae bacterium]|nr:DNA adenine methylase [Caldilineaceae bacterium]